MLTGKDQPERLELRLRTARRGVSVETRPPARAVCRVHGALGLEPGGDCGERAGCGRETGRAVRRGLARDKGGEWAAADASRGSTMAAGGRVQAVPG